MKFKRGDIVKFAIKDPTAWSFAAKFNQLFCVERIQRCASSECHHLCINCQVKRLRRYNLDFTGWNICCYGGFVKATTRESFLYYTQGQDALIEEINEQV